MKKHRLSQWLFSNNYIIFVLAVVISIGIWTYMSLNSTNDTTVTISNVPIQMDLSESSRELGLQMFTDEKQTLSIPPEISRFRFRRQRKTRRTIFRSRA